MRVSFRAKNMGALLDVNFGAMAVVAILGPIAGLLIVVALLDIGKGRGLDYFLMLLSLILFGVGAYAARYCLRLKRVRAFENSPQHEDLVFTPEGISIFMGLIFDGNFLQANHPNERYFVPWNSIVAFEQFQAPRNWSTVWVLTLILASQKDLNIPLYYFDDHKPIVEALNEFHGKYGLHTRASN